MKKLRNKRIDIPIPLLEYRIIVVFTSDIYKYIKSRPRVFGDIQSDNFLAICIRIGRLQTSYCLLPNNSPVSLVAHEVSHAVDDVMKSNGITDTETRAIIFEYIMKNIYESK